MKCKFARYSSLAASFLLLFLLAPAQTLHANTAPEALALKAVSENATEAAPAIAELRALGPSGLSLGLIKRKTQSALSVDGSGRNQEKTFAALVQQLQQNIALDTVRNEYLLHTKLYGWFLAGQDRGDIGKLNKKVYAELFLTPATDPWLGLFSPEVYTALDGGGISR